MDIVASGTLVIAKGEELSLKVGAATYLFRDQGSGSFIPSNTISFGVPFGLTADTYGLAMSGQFAADDGIVMRHRVVFKSTTQPDVVLIHYTITRD